MIHVGDKVRIFELGKVYSSYPGFLDYYRDTGSSSMVASVCGQYKLNRSPTEAEVRDKVFTVMFIREHGSLENRKLAVINARLQAERCVLPMQIGRHVYFKTQFIGGKYEPVKIAYLGRHCH